MTRTRIYWRCMGLFGNLFDLNGDGFAAPEEEILSLMMLDDLLRKEERAEAELWSDDEDELYDEDGFLE